MTTLLPRISLPIAQELAQELRALPIAICKERRAFDHPGLRYDPIGCGTPLTTGELRALAEALTSAAKDAGYPDSPRRDGSDLDNQWAELLHKLLPCSYREASSEEPWAFLTCVLVPDLVRWRWQDGENTEVLDRWVRTTKANRNCFGRLWRRAAFTLVDEADPYRLLRSLGEDEAQQLIERPSLLGHRNVVTCLISVADSLSTQRKSSRSHLVREGAKQLLRMTALIECSDLDPSILHDMVLESVARIPDRPLQVRG